jgi:hypothetical protein
VTVGLGLFAVALIGLAIGVWFGLPGRYTQTPEDIERLMAKGGGTRRPLSKRSINPLAWLQRSLSARGQSTQRRGRGRGGFKLESPEDRKRR